MNKLIIHFLKPLSFLPALLIMYMIFTFSSQTGTESGQLSYKVSQKLVQVGAAILDKDLSQSEIDMYAEKTPTVKLPSYTFSPAIIITNTIPPMAITL